MPKSECQEHLLLYLVLTSELLAILWLVCRFLCSCQHLCAVFPWQHSFLTMKCLVGVKAIISKRGLHFQSYWTITAVSNFEKLILNHLKGSWSSHMKSTCNLKLLLHCCKNLNVWALKPNYSLNPEGFLSPFPILHLFQGREVLLIVCSSPETHPSQIPFSIVLCRLQFGSTV